MIENLKRNIGKRIKAFREAKKPKMSQERLAELCHISAKSISNIERGQGVSLENLEKIVGLLDCSFGDILDNRENEKFDIMNLKNEASALLSEMNKADLARAVRVLHALK